MNAVRTRRSLIQYGGPVDDRPQFADPHGLSIVQVGEDLFCVHHDGIFKSTDMGKTWKFISSVNEDKVFNLFGYEGKVIHAIPSKGGC